MEPKTTDGPKLRDPLSLWLDCFRWLAALQVVFYHVNHRFFVKLQAVPVGEREPGHYIFAGISSFGWPAVMIFFVLSGFLVGGGTSRRYTREGKFDYIDYIVSRISRLWTVLIPSLACIYILNATAAYFFPDSIDMMFGANAEEGVKAWQQDVGTGVCNIGFMQTVLCQQYGGNGALWSLFHEFWYYITFPLFMLAFWAPSSTLIRVVLAVIAVVVLFVLGTQQFVGPNILGYSGIWLLGVVAAVLKRPLLPVNTLTAAAIFLSSLVIWRIFVPTGTPSPDNFWSLNSLFDYMVAVAFSNLLIAMRFSTNLKSPPGGTVNVAMAAFSFSLYCIHTPVINWSGAFLHSVTGRGWRMTPEGPMDYVYAIGCIGVCIAVAWGFAQMTEKHTDSVRLFMRRMRPAWGDRMS